MLAGVWAAVHARACAHLEAKRQRAAPCKEQPRLKLEAWKYSVLEVPGIAPENIAWDGSQGEWSFTLETPLLGQVMYFRFRCDKSVYTSVKGHQERPRGPPMAHMDCTNIYDPCRVLAYGSESARAKILAFWLLGSRLALCVNGVKKCAPEPLHARTWA